MTVTLVEWKYSLPHTPTAISLSFRAKIFRLSVEAWVPTEPVIHENQVSAPFDVEKCAGKGLLCGAKDSVFIMASAFLRHDFFGF